MSAKPNKTPTDRSNAGFIAYAANAEREAHRRGRVAMTPDNETTSRRCTNVNNSITSSNFNSCGEGDQLTYATGDRFDRMRAEYQSGERSLPGDTKGKYATSKGTGVAHFKAKASADDEFPPEVMAFAVHGADALAAAREAYFQFCEIRCAHNWQMTQSCTEFISTQLECAGFDL